MSSPSYPWLGLLDAIVHAHSNRCPSISNCHHPITKCPRRLSCHQCNRERNFCSCKDMQIPRVTSPLGQHPSHVVVVATCHRGQGGSSAYLFISLWPYWKVGCGRKFLYSMCTYRSDWIFGLSDDYILSLHVRVGCSCVVLPPVYVLLVSYADGYDFLCFCTVGRVN